MRNAAVLVLAAAAVGACAVVVATAVRGAGQKAGEMPRELTEAIGDCQEQIRRIEGELERLRPALKEAS